MVRSFRDAVIVSCVATALMAAAPRPAPAITCRAEAKGAAGDAVDVVLRVDADGKIKERLAYWHPATSNGSPRPTSEDEGIPAFDVVYHPTAVGALGEVSMVLVFATRVPARPESMRSGGILLDLDGQSWEADTIGIGSPIGTLITAMFVTGNPRQPDSSELFRALGSGRTARVDVRADGQVIRSQTYDVSRRDARDALFQQAWSEVSVKAATPDVCRAAATGSARQ